jgi:hypothetical protein
MAVPPWARENEGYCRTKDHNQTGIRGEEAQQRTFRANESWPRKEKERKEMQIDATQIFDDDALGAAVDAAINPPRVAQVHNCPTCKGFFLTRYTEHAYCSKPCERSAAAVGN